jgi:hypothetical protein
LHKSEKWFRCAGELFHRQRPTKQKAKNNVISIVCERVMVRTKLALRNPGKAHPLAELVVHWPIAAMSAGTGVTIGVPQ